MKTNINLKLSKMKKKLLKLGVMAAFVLSANIGFAQQTTGDVGANEKVGKSSVLNGTVRVIDNKGTKKYLQVKNGLTLLTDTTPDGGIVSTWQLGGTLTDDTYIDVDGKAYVINGVETATLDAATAITTESDGSGATDSGWAVLVRDEATGKTQKILATDLITAGRAEFPIAANGDVAVTATGLAMGTSINKISVYRNGTKLRAGVDYTLTATDTITLDISAASPNDWTTYAGDIIEVHWIY